MTENFIVKKHIIPASHTRGLERSVRDEDHMSAASLRLAVNQYIPKRNPEPQAGDLTLIFAHGIQCAKECFEPLFDDLISAIPEGIRPPVRAIWIADSASQCESYLLNKDLLGDILDPLDYARDIWHMINHFQAEMPPPLVGVGQSYGVSMIWLVASWHPRIFSGIVAIEPGLGPKKDHSFYLPLKWYPGRAVAKREDRWPSREKARAALRRNHYYKAFEQRVFDKFIQFELCDLEDEKDSSTGAIPVTLTTPKNLELTWWGYPDPPLTGYPKHPADSMDRAHTGSVPGVFAPEGTAMWAALPHIYAPVLLVWATDSPVTAASKDRIRKELGSAPGGNGGVEGPKVKELEVEGTHILSLEKPRETAQATMAWLWEHKNRLDADRDNRKRQPGFQPPGVVHPELLQRYLKL